jgi:hypothetical protein
MWMLGKHVTHHPAIAEVSDLLVHDENKLAITLPVSRITYFRDRLIIFAGDCMSKKASLRKWLVRRLEGDALDLLGGAAGALASAPACLKEKPRSKQDQEPSTGSGGSVLFRRNWVRFNPALTSTAWGNASQ